MKTRLLNIDCNLSSFYIKAYDTYRFLVYIVNPCCSLRYRGRYRKIPENGRKSGDIHS